MSPGLGPSSVLAFEILIGKVPGTQALWGHQLSATILNKSTAMLCPRIDSSARSSQ